MHEHLSVLQSLGIAGEIHVNEHRIFRDPLEQRTCAIRVAVEHLFAGQIGHCGDEFSVEEALFARVGLLGTLFELVESLLVQGKGLVDACGVKSGAEREDESEEDGP
jgi:hypothetical protein